MPIFLPERYMIHTPYLYIHLLPTIEAWRTPILEFILRNLYPLPLNEQSLFKNRREYIITYKIVTTMLTSKETSKNVGHNTNEYYRLYYTYLLLLHRRQWNVFHRSKCVHSPLVGCLVRFVLDICIKYLTFCSANWCSMYPASSVF